MRPINEILACTDYSELDNDEIQALIDYKSEQAAKRAAHDALESERRAAIDANLEQANANAAALRELSTAYEPPRLEVLNFG